MQVLEVSDPKQAKKLVEQMYEDLERRIAASTANCPVEFTAILVKMLNTQSCGKCTSCRIGLKQLGVLIDKVLDGKAEPKDLDTIEELAKTVYLSADCAIGYEGGAQALRSITAFKDDYLYHIKHNNCGVQFASPVPCVSGCPAGVDVPGYLALTVAGKYADAVHLIRKDNPFAAACAMVCEHPCEFVCRRGMIDDPINIRAIKRYAIDRSTDEQAPAKAESTGKKVAVIGGGPAGVSAAYWLACMGHEPTIFEQRKQLGGMLRYGIPSYRLPRERLDSEIAYLASAGIEVKTDIAVGKDISFEAIRQDFDAVYVAIGAHSDNKLGLENEDADGVMSAVELLRLVGDNELPDFTDKSVVVVGGGNVAIDCARTALRLGAKSAKIVYRRRRSDMTALPAEIDAALSEGCSLLDLNAPVEIKVEDGKVCGLTVQQQIVSTVSNGRAQVKAAQDTPQTLSCDLILVAIGQKIDSQAFADSGFGVNRGCLVTADDSSVVGLEGVFAGGECTTGPASAIAAIASAKTAVKAIDTYLGYNHVITFGGDIPAALAKPKPYCGRTNTYETISHELAGDFSVTEKGLSEEEAVQEIGRCLRCDHFGPGALRGGRNLSW